jgi:hypothetical protein
MNDAESGTWTELTSYGSGGTPAADGENYIQGSGCRSQTTGTKSGLVFSIVFDYGSNLAFNTDDVVLMWQFYAVGSNLETYANGGLRAVIASDLSNANAYQVGGSNFARNPYGGWMNVAVDPTKTANYTIGSGNAGNYRYFGSMPYTLANISKGAPHAVDAIRYGRGEITCTGSGCSFEGMAQYNDYNDVSNGYNRLGLFQDDGGVYRWKGLMSLGVSATGATFSDSNKTILVDDTPAVYTNFNKIEVNHADSDITWTNITISSLGTTSPGRFEMADNAALSFNQCVFNSMDTFIFQSNGEVLGCTFNSCGIITSGGADFIGTKVLTSSSATGAAALGWNVASDPNGELDNMVFSKGSLPHHAIEFGTTSPTTMTLTGIDFSGFSASNGQNDSALRFLRTTGTITVTLVGCTGNITYKKEAGATVVLLTDPVQLSMTVKDQDGVSVTGAYAYIDKDNTAPYIMNDTTSTPAGVASVSWTGGAVTGATWRMRKYGFKPYKAIADVPSSGTKDIPVTLITDPQQS